jgi:hypothetical protein
MRASGDMGDDRGLRVLAAADAAGDADEDEDEEAEAEAEAVGDPRGSLGSLIDRGTAVFEMPDSSWFTDGLEYGFMSTLKLFALPARADACSAAEGAVRKRGSLS